MLPSAQHAPLTLESLYEDLLCQLEEIIKDQATPLPQRYSRAINVSLFFRVSLLKQRVLRRLPRVVQSGPFQGMRFHEDVTEGCYIPKLLGCYESELHPALSVFSKENYERVVNIGCAEGYYAVGLARLFSKAETLAFDVDPRAQAACEQLASMNDVADRIVVSGEIRKEQWPALLRGRSLVVCDVEGAEYQLLDPPEIFRTTDMLVELHWTQREPQLKDAFLSRFADTHEIRIVTPGGRNPNDFEPIRAMKQFDQWLCVWEFRNDVTPWAVLSARTA